jgi:hypothetical protein
MPAAKNPTNDKTVIVINYDEKELTNYSFVAVPRLWAEYFNTTAKFANKHNKDGSNTKALRVPSSFLKYLLALWRWLSIPDKQSQYSTSMAMSQFPVRKENAVLWTAALEVSGVIQVKMGKWTANHDVPTVFTYNPRTSHLEWRCFFCGLDLAWNYFQIARSAARQAHKYGRLGTNAIGWKLLVAHEVNKQRTACGLEARCTDWVNLAIKDGEATLDEEGVLHPKLYTATRLRKPGESHDEYEDRVFDEASWQDDVTRNGGFYKGR